LPTVSVSYLEAAMAQADDWSWDRYRPLLKLQFRQLQLDPRLRRRFDGSKATMALSDGILARVS